MSTDTPGVAIWIDPATRDDVASQAWKEVSDQVFIIPGFEHGVGWLVCCVLQVIQDLRGEGKSCKGQSPEPCPVQWFYRDFVYDRAQAVPR